MPTIPNIFTNVSNVEASDHNQNYASAVLDLSNSTSDLVISDILVNGNLDVSSNSIIGNDSSSTLSIPALITASLLSSSGKDLGTSSLPFSSVWLGSSGGLYFDAGTTKYIRASGTELDFSGINHSIAAKIKNCSLSMSSIEASSLNIDGNLKGERHIIKPKVFGLGAGLTNKCFLSTSTSTFQSIAFPSAGSVIGWSVSFYFNISGSGSCRVVLYKNGSSFLTLGTFSTSSDGYQYTRSTQNRGVSTFSASDYFSFIYEGISGTVDGVLSPNIILHVVFDT